MQTPVHRLGGSVGWPATTCFGPGSGCSRPAGCMWAAPVTRDRTGRRVLQIPRNLLGQRIVQLELEVLVRHGCRRDGSFRLEVRAGIEGRRLSPFLAKEQRRHRRGDRELRRRRRLLGSESPVSGTSRRHQARSDPGSPRHIRRAEHGQNGRLPQWHSEPSQHDPRPLATGRSRSLHLSLALPAGPSVSDGACLATRCLGSAALAVVPEHLQVDGAPL